MKLEKITLANFRCFGGNPIEIDLRRNVTAFVGNNGAGKTAIFAALGKLFGVTNAQRKIQKSDFHCAPNIDEVESGATLFIDCLIGFPEMENGDDDIAIPDVFGHMTAAGEGADIKVRLRLIAEWIDNGTPEGIVEEDFRWVTSLSDEFDWDQCRRVSAIERNFIQFVYVPANRNASDQVTSLLKGRLWRAAQWSDGLEQVISTSVESIQDQFEDEEPAKFIAERIERRWEQVHFGDTDSHPELRLVDSRLSDLVRRAEFSFFHDDSDQFRRLEDLSDGQRSLFHIALTAAILEIERDALEQDPDDSVFDHQKLRRTYLTILAIEEPENSLSPFFLSRIMEQAREVGGMTGAQVMISSHSPSILRRIEPEEVRYARRETETGQSSVQALTLPPDDADESAYVRLAIKSYPEIYFARFVILAEGESEAIVLPHLADAMDCPLDRSFVPIVPLGGRFVSHFWRLLEDLSIPYATLLDLDLGRKHGGKNTIAYVVKELQAIGRDLDANPGVAFGDLKIDEIDQIDEAELLAKDQDHPWLKALKSEYVFFSSPIDLDFTMLIQFPGEYRVAHRGGNGPQMTPKAIKSKNKSTLKTDGNPDLYDDEWDKDFAWYPYLFIGNSKPEAHLSALSQLSMKKLRDRASPELTELIEAARSAVFG